MKNFPSRILLYVLFLGMALLSACIDPRYNDNPSQQITTERVGCLVATDFFSVYVTVHVQPFDENPDQRITRDLFRPYCHNIPKPGKVFFTADLVDNGLKTTPIAIEIVEQEFAGGDNSQTENFQDIRTLSSISPKIYSKGVIQTDFEVDKNGYYAIYLIRYGNNAAAEADRLRIPLNVGVGSGARPLMRGILTIVAIVSGLALIQFVAFRYLRNRKT